MEINLDSKREANNALEFTQMIIDKFGPRLAGDKSTHETADYIADELNTFCDSVSKEAFSVYPKAFLGWIRILSVFYVISTIFLWFNIPWIGAILISLGIIIMVMQFFYYKPLIDKLFRKKIGYNVIGKIEPSPSPSSNLQTQEIKQQIIISGHHDSAYVSNFLVHQPNLYPLRIYGGLGFTFLMLIFTYIWTIWNIFSDKIPPFALFWQITASISIILVAQLYFFASNKGTLGAGDNMIATAICIEVGRKITQWRNENNSLKYTRIIIASWDGEEAGLRGAKAYCKKNYEYLKGIPTYNFNMDCIYNLQDLFFLTTDINGTVDLDKNMAQECASIAKSLGYTAETKPIAFLTGGTDAGAFGEINIPATSLIAMPWGNSDRASAYHTPDDKVDRIDPKAVQASIEIILKYIIEKDKE